MLIVTFLTDQIHPSTLSSGPNISVAKSRASSRTSRSAKVHSTSFRLKDDLLFSYPRFSLVTTSTDFLLCQYQHTGPEFSSSYLQIDGIWDNTLDYKNLMSTTVLCCRPHLLLPTTLWTGYPSFPCHHHHCYCPLLKMRKVTWLNSHLYNTNAI